MTAFSAYYCAHFADLVADLVADGLGELSSGNGADALCLSGQLVTVNPSFQVIQKIRVLLQKNIFKNNHILSIQKVSIFN